MIVDEGEARINYRFIEIESECVLVESERVLVESEIKHNILHKNIKKRKLKAIFSKKMRQENDCFATRYLLRNR